MAACEAICKKTDVVGLCPKGAVWEWPISHIREHLPRDGTLFTWLSAP
jgi:hypothetical protein